MKVLRSGQGLKFDIVKEFVINGHVSVVMARNGRVYTAVDGKPIVLCAHALLDVPQKGDEDAYSMDDVLTKLDTYTSNDVDAGTEFVAHSSNVQAWVESGYDPRLIDSRIAVPVLKAVSRSDDAAASRLAGLMLERFLETPAEKREWFFSNYGEMLAGEVDLVLLTSMLKQMENQDGTLEVPFDKFLASSLKRRKYTAEEISKFVVDNARLVTIWQHSAIVELLQPRDLKKLLASIPLCNFCFENPNFDHMSRKWTGILLRLCRKRGRDIVNEMAKISMKQAVLERMAFIAALRDCSLRPSFSGDEWNYLLANYEKLQGNASWFLNGKFLSIWEWNLRSEADATREIYGKEWEMSWGIRNGDFYTNESGPADYPSLVWSKGKFWPVMTSSDRKRGVTHVFFCIGLKIKRIDDGSNVYFEATRYNEKTNSCHFFHDLLYGNYVWRPARLGRIY